MMRLVLLLWVTLCLATPADAGPLAAAIGGIVTGISSTLAAGGIGAFAIRLAGGLALSALSQALQPKPAAGERPGLREEFTSTGGVEPQQIIFGRYVTPGHRVCPPMTFGYSGDTENEYLTEVIELADHRIKGLAYLLVDGERVNLDVPAPHSEMQGAGMAPASGHRLHEYIAVRVLDGTQTAADPWLMGKFAGYPSRPWQADMIGTGTAYAVVTFRGRPKIWKGRAELEFVVDGAPLYDPRKDGSVGGSGPQRWASPGTWQWTENPEVMRYNLKRGFRMPDGEVYGYKADPPPLASWIAAMNAADQEVGIGGGTTQPRYRAGFSFPVSTPPINVDLELAKASNAEQCEAGGNWVVAVGAPPPPAFYITDGNIITTSPREFDPFPPVDQIYNGVSATFVRADKLWQPGEIRPILRADWEAEDGRRNVASLQLSAVTDPRRANRVSREKLKDHRRMRMHVITLPSQYWVDRDDVVPTATIGWSSTRNGYSAKLFEIVRMAVDPISLNVTLGLRERDPSDYDPDLIGDGLLPADPSTDPVRPPIAGVVGFGVEPWIGRDGNSGPRLAGFRMFWNPDASYQTLRWRARVKATGELHGNGVVDIDDGEKIVRALPVTTYEVRAEVVSRRETVATGWIEVTTPDVRLGPEDIGIDYLEFIATSDALSELVTQEMGLDFDALRAEFAAAGDALETSIGSVNTDLQGYKADVSQQYVALGQFAGLETRVMSALASSLTDTFIGGLANWTSSATGSPDTVAAPNPAWSAVEEGGAWVARLAVTDVVTSTRLATRGALSVRQGEKCAITVRARCSGSSLSDADPLRVEYRWLDADYAAVGEFVTSEFALPTVATEHRFEATAPAGAVYLRGSVWFERMDFVTPATAVVTVEKLRVEGLGAVDALRAEVYQSFYTKVQTDQAVSAAETGLEAQIGAVSATLTQQYYTKVTIDAALSASETRLSAQIAADPPSNFDADFTYWTSASAGRYPDPPSAAWSIGAFSNQRHAILTLGIAADFSYLHTRGAIAVRPGDRVRLEVAARHNGANPVMDALGITWRWMDSDYNALTPQTLYRPLNSFWTAYAEELTAPAEAFFLRAGVLVAKSRFSGTAGDVRVRRIKVDNLALFANLEATVGNQSQVIATHDQALAQQVLFAETSGGGIASMRLTSLTDLVGGNSGSLIEFNSDLAVFRNKRLNSANYVPGSAGWMLNRNGTMELNRLIVRKSIALGGVETENLADFATAKIGSAASVGNTSITVSHLPGSTLIVFVSAGSALAAVTSSTNKSRNLRLVITRNGGTIGTEEQDPTIENGGRLPPLTFFRIIPSVGGTSSTFAATLSGSGVIFANTHLAIFESKR